jgi:hypothetical protein
MNLFIDRNQEVAGSNPLSSTKITNKTKAISIFGKMIVFGLCLQVHSWCTSGLGVFARNLLVIVLMLAPERGPHMSKSPGHHDSVTGTGYTNTASPN